MPHVRSGVEEGVAVSEQKSSDERLADMPAACPCSCHEGAA